MRSTTPAAPVIKNVLLSGALDGDLATVKLTVDVTDPDGLSDIAGGKLFSKDKSKFLGAFTQLSGGTFTTDLTWKTVNEVETLGLQVPLCLSEGYAGRAATGAAHFHLLLSARRVRRSVRELDELESRGGRAFREEDAVNGCADPCGPTGCACDCG